MNRIQTSVLKYNKCIEHVWNAHIIIVHTLSTHLEVDQNDLESFQWLIQKTELFKIFTLKSAEGILRKTSSLLKSLLKLSLLPLLIMSNFHWVDMQIHLLALQATHNNIALAYNFVSEISIDRHYSFPDTCSKTKVFARAASCLNWTWSQKGMWDIRSK